MYPISGPLARVRIPSGCEHVNHLPFEHMAEPP